MFQVLALTVLVTNYETKSESSVKNDNDNDSTYFMKKFIRQYGTLFFLQEPFDVQRRELYYLLYIKTLTQF